MSCERTTNSHQVHGIINEGYDKTESRDIQSRVQTSEQLSIVKFDSVGRKLENGEHSTELVKSVIIPETKYTSEKAKTPIRSNNESGECVENLDRCVFREISVDDSSERKETIEESKQITKDSEYGPREKWRILRNVILLSISYLVLFTAFKGAGNLQSSINMEDGLGTISLMAYYGAFIVSSVFLPVIMIQRLGCKWTIAISSVTYIPYIAALFRSEFSTLVPGALSAGVGAGPIWCAISTYTSIVAEAYSQVTGLSTEVVTTKLYGIFYMIYQLNQVSGNLISSLVFSTGGVDPNATLTDDGDQENSIVCGATFCPGAEADDNPNLQRPPEDQITLLAWIYLACVLLAAVTIAAAVDSLDRYHEKTREGSGKGATGLGLLAVTLGLLRNPYQLLLLPIMIFFGMEKAFLGAEYNAVYVSCAVGIHNIGYTMIFYGITNSASSFLTSSLVRLVGRRPVMAATVVLHVALLVTLLLWAPGPADVSLLYSLATIWGVLDGFWLVQLNAMISLLFPGNEEAAFSNYHLWESLGYIVSYGYSTILCTNTKLYLMLAMITAGVMGYFAIECAESKRQRREVNTETRKSST